AQGRNLYRDCAQAVKQVFAEKALPHHGGHIAIGCGQNPDIHSNFPGAADMPERGGIEDAQQLGLGRWAYLPDLIEENRSTMGDFEQSRLGAIRSGERATLVAEQFALKQVFLYCGALDYHEWPRPSGTACVNQLGHPLLSRARLAGYEHGRIAGRHPIDQTEQAAEFRAVTDEGTAEIRGSQNTIEKIRSLT